MKTGIIFAVWSKQPLDGIRSTVHDSETIGQNDVAETHEHIIALVDKLLFLAWNQSEIFAVTDAEIQAERPHLIESENNLAGSWLLRSEPSGETEKLRLVP